ncbi:nose resistant to fluoxetine protein 6, partial [Trichonephila inaurata madagascariensis]
MDTSSNFPSYDYPWQATLAKISLRLKYEIHALSNVSVVSQQHVPKKLTAEAKYMIFIISIFLILAAIGTTITAYDNYYKPKKKRRSSDGEINVKKHIHSDKGKTSNESSEVWFEKLKAFFSCFCIYANGRRLLKTASKEEDFLWLHGLRFLGSFFSIAAHVTIYYILSLSNLKGLKPWVNHWVAPFLLNGAFKISFYFVLSGFLNGYFVSRYYFQNGGIPWIYFCWKRLERTAPLSAMILGFYATLFSYTGSGPLWPTYDTNPVCKESWWWNLFFINNFQTTWEQCYIPLWHVAIDMQFHLIAPLFLVSLF